MFTSPFSSRRKSLAAVVLVAVVAAFGLTGGGVASAAAPAPTGSISGIVYGGVAETPLANAFVELTLPGGDFVQYTNTDANGNYSFTGVPAATYVLFFQANYGDNYAQQYWSGAGSLATATPIPLANGQSLTGLNVTLADGATVTGEVDTGSGPTAGVQVSILDASGNYISSGSTDENGTYSINGLPAGSFTAEFTVLGGSSDTNQWWNDESSQANADFFTLTAGATTTDIDASFGTASPSASVSGTVYGPDSSPVSSETVQAIAPDGSEITGTSTASDGTYTLTGLSAGTYTLEFQGVFTNPDLAQQWWQDEPSFAAADFFTVNAGDNLTGYDADLAVGGQIDGTAYDGAAGDSPMANVSIGVDQDGTNVGVAGWTDANGNYSITGLAPGNYEIQFQASYPSNDVTQWWKDAASEATSTPVTVTDGGVVTGIDATMQAGGSISGTVTGKAANGAIFPVANAQIAVYNSDGTLFTNSYYGGDDGTYLIPAVPAGSYTLYFTPQPDTTDFVPQWWKNQATEATATQVVVAAGQNKKNINPVLASTTLKTVDPKITGTVKVGSTLTAKPGKWAPGTVSFSYQWSRNGVQVGGATGSTYVLTNADANAPITVTVTGSEPGFTTDALTSAARGPVTGGILSTGTPTISGTATVGQVLTADPGSWGPGVVNLTYKWFRGTARVAGATSSTYTLVKADAGKAITVKVTGAEPGFTTATVASASTAVVAH